MLKALIKRITDYLNHRHEWMEWKAVKEYKIKCPGFDCHRTYAIGHWGYQQCSDTSCSKIRKVRI